MARPEKQPHRFDRRKFLDRSTKIGAALAVLHYSPITAAVETTIAVETGIERGSVKEALDVYKSKIIIPEDQEERLANPANDTLWLVFPGLGGRDAGHVAKAVTPALGREGKPVGYVEYSINGVDAESIAKELKEKQKKYPHLKKLAIYGHSNGTHSAANAYEFYKRRLQGDMKLAAVVLDGTPLDAASTRPHFAALAEIVGKLDPLKTEDPTLTMLENLFIFHKPIASRSAPPRLLWDQVREIRQGRHSIDFLSQVAKTDKTKAYYIRATDAKKDPIDDPDKAEEEYRKRFGNFTVIKTKGENEGHANPDFNVAEYDRGIRENVWLGQ
jgi:hypothetical protein